VTISRETAEPSTTIIRLCAIPAPRLVVQEQPIPLLRFIVIVLRQCLPYLLISG
jgi:hypothetical protein